VTFRQVMYPRTKQRPFNVDEAYEIELNKRRAAIASGEMAPGELLNWSYADRGTLYENHIIIIGDEAGGLKTHLTDAGGTPIETPFDSKVHEAMKPAVQRCQARAAQTLQMTVYNAWLDIADKKVPGGPYKVYCYPGSESEQKAQSAETKIEGIMASGDVDIESRRAISAGVLIRDRLAKFDAEYPNPTGQQTYDNCVSIKIALNNDFRTAEDRWTDAEMRKSCEHHL